MSKKSQSPNATVNPKDPNATVNTGDLIAPFNYPDGPRPANPKETIWIYDASDPAAPPRPVKGNGK
jgi:hypothetical protein